MPKTANAQVTLNALSQHIILKDVYQRRHIEACGLLLGNTDAQGNWYVEDVLPLRNIFNSPVYFEFAPEDLLTADIEYPGKVIGVYHSHPTGLAAASSTDRENMKRVNKEQHIPWIWLIISGPFNETFQQKQSLASSIVAYHHYEESGLQKISIQLEEKSA